MRPLIFRRPFRIVVAPIEGGEGKVVREMDPDDPWPIDLTWSPDGKSILYILNDPSNNQARELWSVPIDGGEPTRFELAMEGMVDLRLHPNGKRVVFSAGTSSAEIWVMENFLPKEEHLNNQ